MQEGREERRGKGRKGEKGRKREVKKRKVGKKETRLRAAKSVLIIFRHRIASVFFLGQIAAKRRTFLGVKNTGCRALAPPRSFCRALAPEAEDTMGGLGSRVN